MRLLELGDSDHLPGQGRGDRLLFLAVQVEQMPQAFFRITSGVVHYRVAIHLARIDREHRQPAGWGVQRLEHASRERRGRVRRALDHFVRFGVRTAHRPTVGWGGQVIDDGIEQRLYPGSPQAGATQHREEAARHYSFTQALYEFLGADLLTFQVTGQEVVIHFSDCFDELVTVLLSFGLDFGWDVLLLHSAVVPLEERRSHG